MTFEPTGIQELWQPGETAIEQEKTEETELRVEHQNQALC
jgi:hypothetical protein